MKTPVPDDHLQAMPLRGASTGPHRTAEDPLRQELFSTEQLGEYARAIAGLHELDSRRGRDELLARLADNANVLTYAYDQENIAAEKKRELTATSEWLLDNFYMIEEQICIARQHLPKGYSRQLPRLKGTLPHLPRVYSIVLELISHVDGRVDAANLTHFVRSYQAVSVLTLGELWAIPIMLRLALIENLRRVAARLTARRKDFELADYWVDRLIARAESDPTSLVVIVAEMAQAGILMTGAFVGQFSRRMQHYGNAPSFAVAWLEQKLAHEGFTLVELVRSDMTSQVVEHISMNNSIGSLRALGGIDWPDFVDHLSIVEQELCKDPSGVYGRMDFFSRDACRHQVENVSRRSGLAEVEVARCAVELSVANGASGPIHGPKGHVGYYLMDDGLPSLMRAVKIGWRPVAWLSAIRRLKVSGYLGLLAVVSVVIASLPVLQEPWPGPHGWLLLPVGVLALLCASQIASTVVHWLVMLLVPSRALPRMDYSAGIPAEFKTLVVVPTMLADMQGVQALVDDLEVRYLANRDAQVSFALLTDHLDAPSETMPGDAEIVALASAAIAELNAKYEGEERSVFFLFHRARTWNEQQGAWMGYERKRGKLSDLNALLQGDPANRFSHIVGDTSYLKGVKYVITLDTDTRLPRGAAHKLVATMAHPLNQPSFSRGGECIERGYSILQPRVGVSLPSARRSWYVRLFGGDAGIDPYTRTVSDVYQDLFGEGSFIGKGIYDLDAFQHALDSRFPENLILSHDLLEGCYARCGLVSDVELFEDHPYRYITDVSRRTRWIRGDWQIAQYAFHAAERRLWGGPGACLSRLSRWKILDNLRRSLVAPGAVALLLLAWLMLQHPVAWTLFVVAVFAMPALLGQLGTTWRRPADFPWRLHLAECGRGFARHALQGIFTLTMLPHEAYYSLLAIVRTLYRVHISKRHLLEWTTAGQAGGRASLGRWGLWQEMGVGPVLSLVAVCAIATQRPDALLAALPILLLWALGPELAWWVSQPLLRRTGIGNDSQRDFLEKLSRKTWRFFETFAGPADHWLPIDNFQEYPVVATAHRTSPTNMGMYLLANFTAYDFGYISCGDLVERTRRTLDSMLQLERHAGHFYNWYDTHTLKPLEPLYVSTVDSGNLAGHLLTLRQGLLALPHAGLLPPRHLRGLRDTLGVCADTLAAIPTLAGAQTTDVQQALLAATSAVQAAMDSHMALAGAEYVALLQHLEVSAAVLVTAYAADDESDAKFWTVAFRRQCCCALHELKLLAPWLFLDAEDLLVLGPWLARQAFSLETLAGLAKHDSDGLWAQIRPAPDTEIVAAQRGRIIACVALAAQQAQARLAALEHLADVCRELADMDYEFLYDTSRHLMSIGYNVTDRRRDVSCYDLLASESRLASFVAIAQNQLPQEHWFALGRQLTSSGTETALLSWSGSMFEYLMPLLVMPNYEGTLLSETYQAVISRQIEYGRERGVPWGISESGYNFTDARQDYQYRAFGVPGLGLKRGLSKDLVIAPYATVMALMVDPERACANLHHMTTLGFQGRYGMYEAVDYTPARLARAQRFAIVRSFMAHHQGMSFVALAHLLLERPMERRFMADAAFRAADLLLQERVPKAIPVYSHAIEVARTIGSAMEVPNLLRVIPTPHTPHPEVRLLSNGRYSVMVTNAGGGYSRWNSLSLTRWREDTTRDNWGQFCYIKDLTTNTTWSAAYQPLLTTPDRYESIFSPGRAEFRRWDSSMETHTDIMVSAEDDVELRRITVSNSSGVEKLIEFTTYAEVVIAAQASDETHPAFSNLFVQTEIFPERQAILCTRRPRAPGEEHPWMVHLVVVTGAMDGPATYETDRMQFLGRGHGVENPVALQGHALSGTSGSVLDPIVAIRCRVRIETERNCVVDIVTGVAKTREGALALMDKYHDRRLTDRIAELSGTHEQMIQRQVQATVGDMQIYEQLASSLVYSHQRRRASVAVLEKNVRSQAGLWGYGISGDVPIVLVRIDDREQMPLVREVLQAHAYLRLMGLISDLVVCNEDRSGYRQELQDEIVSHVTSGGHPMDRPGGVFVRRVEQIPEEDFVLLQSAARAVLAGDRGSLADQISRRYRSERSAPPLETALRPRTRNTSTAHIGRRTDLIFDNGYGGFTPDGREYVIRSAANMAPPAPWSNVIANAFFGTVVTESGGGYTWNENAHEFRLTPWSNDAVTDARGEAIYVRDEESGVYWSPTPQPCPGSGGYITRHGFGYSVFHHADTDISTELCVYVAMDAPVKFMTLKLRNTSGRTRKLSVTGYVEWVLGESRHKTAPYIVSALDDVSGAVLAWNCYHLDMADRVAFFDVSEFEKTFTGDRAEFIGRNGSLAWPNAMARQRLTGRQGTGLDPCTAVQVMLELGDGHEREITFVLGAGRNLDDARNLVRQHRGNAPARRALENVWRYWNDTLGAVQIETPDKSLDVLANGWLLYQTLSCRMWGRSGFYQSGGAFGFRDQLQDSMALIHTRPGLMRAHLLHSASNQFSEGDVQHWWHPPLGRGVRTHCSDDLLWLPLAVARYVACVGDTGVLHEQIPYIQAPPLRLEDESRYDQPHHGGETGTLYDHCVRAIRKALAVGVHGLPLMGGCDWNDGMNLVGHEGRGESVWLAFFLHRVLLDFESIARLQNDEPTMTLCAVEAQRLRDSIDAHAWDGDWFRRAYFDDGQALGSIINTECRIDSISQSWSVLSGVGRSERQNLAMASLDKHLVRDAAGIVLLLDPPFDTAPLEPGYIKGYLPGVRENGGQYTHAAIWATMAFAAMGEKARAWELMSMINPVNHGGTAERVEQYRIEPYVAAADVYGLQPHTGRGGWSWYTGSAAWMYRLILESLLGIQLQVDRLVLSPSMPTSWRAFVVTYRYHKSTYRLEFSRSGEGHKVGTVTLDGQDLPGYEVPLVDDGQTHQVRAQIG